MPEMLKCCMLFAMIAFATGAVVTRPKFIECFDSRECAIGTCCAVGLGKFSTPKCQPLVERGEMCRFQSQTATNASLTYPGEEGDQIVHFTEIHMIQCPCAHGLYCSHMTGVCEDHLEDSKHNGLDYDISDD